MADFIVARAVDNLTRVVAAQQRVLNNNLAAINLNLYEINVTLATELGAAASGVPGSIRNSAANQATMLSNISSTLMEIESNNQALLGSIGELSNSVKAQTSSLSYMATVQSIVAADQIANNAFQRAETLASLERNEITPATLPDFQTLVKQQIENSSVMRATSEFQSAVSSFTNNILDGLKSYIADSAIVTWGRDTLNSLYGSLGLTKLIAKGTQPDKIVRANAKNTTNNLATAGTWSPSNQPPVDY